MFKCGVTFSIGDGGLVNFWTDIWLGESSLATQFHLIYCAVRSHNIRVQDCYGTNGWDWRKICSGFTPQSQPEEVLLDDLKTTLNGIQLSDGRDDVRWRWSRSEVFSVKSMYLFLQDSGEADARFDHLWKLKLPLKVKVFVWLVLRRRVLTVDVLLKRGWSGVNQCVLCLGSSESVDHLFLGCAFTNKILTTLLPHFTGIRTIAGVQDLWKTCTGKSGSLPMRELSFIAATWWIVWLERNSRRFEDKRRELDALIAFIRCHCDLWTTYCP